jgi:hypothetical protein
VADDACASDAGAKMAGGEVETAQEDAAAAPGGEDKPVSKNQMKKLAKRQRWAT